MGLLTEAAEKIPGLDDGAATEEDSVNLMNGLANLGFRKVITTPHVMSDYYRNTTETILAGRDRLRELAAQHGIPLEIDAAAEYYLDEGFTEPIHLNASGEDPDAFYKDQPQAWAIYQVREWKRVLTVSGGAGKERRVQITETP